MKPVEAEHALIVGLHSTLWDSYPVLKVSWKTKLSSSQKKGLERVDVFCVAKARMNCNM